MFRFSLRCVLTAALSTLFLSSSRAEEPLKVESPNGVISASVAFVSGQPLLSADFAGRTLLSPSAILPTLDPL